jgi:hypothetical protein
MTDFFIDQIGEGEQSCAFNNPTELSCQTTEPREGDAFLVSASAGLPNTEGALVAGAGGGQFALGAQEDTEVQRSTRGAEG